MFSVHGLCNAKEFARQNCLASAGYPRSPQRLQEAFGITPNGELLVVKNPFACFGRSLAQSVLLDRPEVVDRIERRDRAGLCCLVVVVLNVVLNVVDVVLDTVHIAASRKVGTTGYLYILDGGWRIHP